MKKILIATSVLSASLTATAWSEEIAFDSLMRMAGEDARVIGFKYPELETRAFLKEVLISLSLPFATEKDSSGVTIYWNPSSTEQEQEVQNRVSQYDFVRMVCQDLELPSPIDPAKSELSCRK